MRGERKNTQRMRRMANDIRAPYYANFHGVHPTYILCPNIIPVTNSIFGKLTFPAHASHACQQSHEHGCSWPSLKA